MGEVHKPKQRLFVEEKLTGRAVYGADLHLPGMLYAKGVSIRCASARILGIHGEECLATEGVCGLFTAKDLPGENGFGLFARDEPVFAGDRVKFAGDVIALVVARSPEAAEAGAGKVRVDWEPLPAVLTIEDALQARAVVNPDYPDNICAKNHVVKGEAGEALDHAAWSVDETYETSWVEHAYLEPEVMAVVPLEDGRLEIRGAMQHPFYMREVVCAALNLPLERVVVHPDTLGGSFGGKVEISAAMAARAALAAQRLGRPVLYVLSREESIAQSHKRHGIRFRVHLGADTAGRLQGLEVHAMMDGGAYVNESPIVAWKTVTCGPGPYEIPNVYYENCAVMTNNMVCGAMRGFGTPQAIFAMENAMNELAQKMGISPLELRRRNLLGQGGHTGTNHCLQNHAVSIRAVMERAAEDLGFEEKYARYSRPQTGPLRRGVGIACSIRGVSFGADSEDTGRARIRLAPEGVIEFFCPMMEMGQGADTVLTQICADALGVPMEQVRRMKPETEESPDTGAAGASRGTFIGGNAIIRCVDELKGQIASAFQVPRESVAFREGRVAAGEDHLVTWQALYEKFAQMGRTLDAVARYTVPRMSWQNDICQGEAFVSYTYSCHAAEVEVDTDTGRTRVLQVAACHDAGRIINPQTAAGQVSGGIAMGVGMALMEQVQTDAGGVIRTDNYDTYLLPTALDVGNMTISFEENPDASGPFGCKSLGEPAMEPAAAAVLGAVNHALGNAGAVRTMPADIDTVFFAAHPEWKGESQ